MSDHKPLSRRTFLKQALTGLGVAATPALLAACGSQSLDEPAANAPTADTAPTTAAPAADVPSGADAPTTAAPAASTAPVELTWWDPLVTQEPWILNEIKLFEEANTGITVKRIKQPKMDDALTAAFQDKSLPDLFMNGGPPLNQAALSGWLTPISDFADYEAFTQTYPNPEIDFFNGSNIFDGKTYAAPFEARGAMWNCLFANTKVLKDAGIVDDKGEAKLPQTLDELIAAAQTVAQKGNGQTYGFAVAVSEFNGAFWPWWWGYRSGAPFDGLDGQTGKSTYGANPVYNQILDFFVKSRNDGWIHPQSATANDEAIRALFAEGGAAFIPNGVWAIAGWQQTHPDFKEYVPFAPPLIGTDKQLGWYGASPGGSFLLIGGTTKHPEEAWKLFKHIHSKEAGKRWVQSSNGTSIWPENNAPEFMGSPQQQAYFEANTANTRVTPPVPPPDSDMDKVQFGDTKPNEVALIQGVFTGQISDIGAALTELAAAKDAMREQAFADASKAGASKIGFEYLAWAKQYPDWDPSAGKDYVPNKS